MKKLYFVNWFSMTKIPIKDQIKKYFSHTAEKLQIVNDHNGLKIDRLDWNFYSKFSGIENLISEPARPDYNKRIFQVLEFNVNQNDVIAFLCCEKSLIPWGAKYYIYDHDNKKIKLITEEMF